MLMDQATILKHYTTPADGVLHLGAHWGEEAGFYVGSLKVDRVIWVEALPEAVRILKQNVADNPKHTVYQACLSDRTGDKVKFNIANNQGQSSSFLEFGIHLEKHKEVKFIGSLEMTTVTCYDLLCATFPVFDKNWFLNVDLQGAELKAIRGMGSLFHQFKYAYVEVNREELYKGCALVGEIDSYLAGFGFVGVKEKWTGAGWGDKMYVRK
jgi:FkbM family methyltransferase